MKEGPSVVAQCKFLGAHQMQMQVVWKVSVAVACLSAYILLPIDCYCGVCICIHATGVYAVFLTQNIWLLLL